MTFDISIISPAAARIVSRSRPWCHCCLAEIIVNRQNNSTNRTRSNLKLHHFNLHYSVNIYKQKSNLNRKPHNIFRTPRPELTYITPILWTDATPFVWTPGFGGSMVWMKAFLVPTMDDLTRVTWLKSTLLHTNASSNTHCLREFTW